MISMAYAPRCEPDRFAMRNDSFLRRNGLNDLETAYEIARFAMSRILSLSCSWTGWDPLRGGGAGSSGLAPPGPRSWPACGWRSKKSRESAAKPLKRLLGINLCAARPFGRRGLAGDSPTRAVKEGNSAPSSQAFVVAESGQTTVEFWRRVFKDHAFPCGTEAMPPVVPSAGEGPHFLA
jgi:hypothetical protein